MATCTERECPLYGKKQVPYAGNKTAKLVYLGESPGNKETRFGVPFYEFAAAGMKAREMVSSAGLLWDEIFLMNSARCMILKDDMSTKDIAKTLACCRKFVVAGLKALKPQIVIVAGDMAMRQVLKKSGISKARGSVYWSEEFLCWVAPTFHPAYICRNDAKKVLVVEDLKQVGRMLKNGGRPVQDEGGKRYIEVQSIAPLLYRAGQEEVTLGIDTELQGLDFMDPNYLCISYSISFRNRTGCNIILFEECPDEASEFCITWMRAEEGKKKKEPTEVYLKRADNFEQKVDELEALLAHNGIKKYMQNGNTEWHAFRWLFRRFRDKVPVINRYVMDIQAVANVIDENIYQLADLGTLQRMFTTDKVDYKQEFAAKYDKSDMLNISTRHPNDYLMYAVGDSDITRQVGLAQREWLLQHPKQANYVAKFTMPTMETLAVMEEHGAMIDLDRMPEVKAEVDRLLAEHSAKALAAAPAEILRAHEKPGLKLTRDRLVRDILFDDVEGFGLEVLKRTKGKEPSCDKEVRALLLDRPLRRRARTFLNEFNLWSEYHTLATRYLSGFDKHVKWDGRIHCRYNLARTVTGRTSTQDPNMQNNPKRSESAHLIRRLICAPPGYVLMSTDASQSELRWAAHLSGDPAMIKIFREGKIDIHTATAMLLCSEDWSRLDDKEKKVYRRNAKAVNFGLLYLMGLNGFIKYCKIEYGIDLDKRQGQAWIDMFFGTYRMLQVYHRKTIEFGRKNGYVESVLGRRRHLPELLSDDNALRHEAERMAVNHPIQGPSSDTVLLSANEIRKEDWDPAECRNILFVHDELCFEVREDKVQEYAPRVKWHMENPPLARDFDVELKVPLAAEIKVGRNLAEMEELKLAA